MEDNNLHNHLLMKTQKLIFFGHLITAVFVVVGLMSQMAFSTMPAYYSLLPLFANVIVAIVGAVCYFKFRGTYTYSRIVILLSSLSMHLCFSSRRVTQLILILFR